jgi:hypothetical protein
MKIKYVKKNSDMTFNINCCVVISPRPRIEPEPLDNKSSESAVFQIGQNHFKIITIIGEEVYLLK